MTKDKIKEVMDACYQAKRIRDMLPAKNSLLALDARLHFAGFFYLETIQFLRKRGYGL